MYLLINGVQLQRKFLQWIRMVVETSFFSLLDLLLKHSDLITIAQHDEPRDINREKSLGKSQGIKATRIFSYAERS
jgi:hypothetical protein